MISELKISMFRDGGSCLNNVRVMACENHTELLKYLKLDWFKNIVYFNPPLYFRFWNNYESRKSDEDIIWNPQCT